MVARIIDENSRVVDSAIFLHLRSRDADFRSAQCKDESGNQGLSRDSAARLPAKPGQVLNYQHHHYFKIVDGNRGPLQQARPAERQAASAPACIHCVAAIGTGSIESRKSQCL